MVVRGYGMKTGKYKRGWMPYEKFLKLPTSKKKSEMVAWLMRKGKTIWEARTIAHRKFYHGDPFGGEG